jgi:hypothetical protein
MKRSLKYFIGILVVIGGMFFFDYGKYAQIRLDTGDVRYCFLGIPFYYKYTPSQTRSAIISITGKDPSVEKKWFTCVIFPKKGSNNVELMYHNFYEEAAAWIRVDPKIASYIFKDIAADIVITSTKPEKEQPEGLQNYWQALDVVHRRNNEYYVDPNWKETEVVNGYLKQKGLYNLSP